MHSLLNKTAESRFQRRSKGRQPESPTLYQFKFCFTLSFACKADDVGSAVCGIMIRELIITVPPCLPILLMGSSDHLSFDQYRLKGKILTPKDTLFPTVDRMSHIFHAKKIPQCSWMTASQILNLSLHPTTL